MNGKILDKLKNSNRAFWQNALWMVWSGAVSIANSLVVWVFMARWRDVEELGRFTFAMSLYFLFYTVCSLGLIPFIVNEVSRLKEKNAPELNKFIGTNSIALFVWGIISGGLMTLSAFVFGSSQEAIISSAILSLAMIPTGTINVAEAVSIAFGKVRLIALVTTLENLLRTILPLSLLWFGFGVPAICASFVFVRFVSLAVYFLIHKETLDFRHFDAEILRRILKVVPTFAGITIFASLNWQIVGILMGKFSTESETALYGVASRFLVPVMILMAGYASVLQPLLAQYSPEKLGVFLSKMIRKLLFVVTFGAVLTPFFSKTVLTLLFGETYAAAAVTLNILALTVVPFCAVMLIGRALIAAESQHIDLIANAFGFVICAVSGLILIPRYGANGAATAQLFSFVGIALTGIFGLSRKITNFNIWRTTAISTGCLLTVFIFMWKF